MSSKCPEIKIKPCDELNSAIEEAQRRHDFFKKTRLSKASIVMRALREYFIREGIIKNQ